MEKLGATQTVLQAAECSAFVANVSWHPGQGWRVWVASGESASPPRWLSSDLYDGLTAGEAMDVLQAEVWSRCEWLRG